MFRDGMTRNPGQPLYCRRSVVLTSTRSMLCLVKIQPIFQVVLFVVRRWSLLMSFLTFPKLPDDWTDKEKVRVFVVAFATSDATRELTALTPTQWDDHTRALVAALANQKVLWDLVWDTLYRADNREEKTIEPKTIRERIRSRFAKPVNAQEAAVAAGIDDGVVKQ